jgi:phage tail sheath protein FI
MYAYRTPGVYFEWLDMSVHHVAPVRTDVAGLVGLAERGPVERPTRITSVSQFTAVFGGHVAWGHLAYAVQGFFDNGGRAAWMVRVEDDAAARTASLVVVDEGGAALARLSETSPGTWGNRRSASVVSGEGGRRSILLRAPDGTQQVIRDLRAELERTRRQETRDAADEDEARQAVVQSDLELLVRAEPASLADTVDGLVVRVGGPPVHLAGGADAFDRLRPEHFRRALASLEAIDEVAVLAVPDLVPKPGPVAQRVRPAVLDCSRLEASAAARAAPPHPSPPSFEEDVVRELQEAMLGQCMRLGDRFAILDLPNATALPEEAQDWSRRFRQQHGGSRALSYGALYYPWVLVPDPLAGEGALRALPPSGHLAGVFARTDLTQGVHQAPANEIVEGVSDVTHRTSDAAHGDLNEESVNVIRAFPGGSLRVAGGRTLLAVPPLRYVSVRRLLSMIAEAVDEQTQWIPFEPSKTLLREEMGRSVRGLLEDLYRRGMLAGATAAEAYSVLCDETNNPPEEADAGRMVCDIGIQPPWPAEFVVVRIGKTESGVEVVDERSLEHA